MNPPRSLAVLWRGASAHRAWARILPLLLFALSARPAAAGTSIYTNGVGARSMSLGGADVGWASDPLGAIGVNPAGLSSLDRIEADLGANAAIPTGHFDSRVNGNGSLSEDFEVGPDFGLGGPIGTTPVSFGLGVFPKAGLTARWNYLDPPGGLGGKTSYGNQNDTSKIELLRTAAALSVKLGPMFSLGASLNLDYNQNWLETPYVFQTQPKLAGFKTLLDLSTTGLGLSASTGVLFKPCDSFQIGVAYQSSTSIGTEGSASGNAGAQLKSLGGPFAAVQHQFHYDAEVDNNFPQMVSGGLSWKFHTHWRLALQTDWVNWSDAFNTLPIKLTNGSNRDLNTFLGRNSLQDNIPLQWSDRFVYRAGIEYEVTENFVLRTGYSFSQSPVPSQTLTPLTAVIPENTLTFGAGYKWDRYRIDLAYQWDLPFTRDVDDSTYLSGEYNHASTRVSVQSLALTVAVRF